MRFAPPEMGHHHSISCDHACRNEKYKQSARTSAGADKWLDVTMWDNTSECLKAVKSAGYQLVVTHLTKGSVAVQVNHSMSGLVWSQPTPGASTHKA